MGNRPRSIILVLILVFLVFFPLFIVIGLLNEPLYFELVVE